ncbi:YciI family protein [Hyphobacterium sp.]|uniref:YciI family protein n=1 Tax=Hyphobacterium sp. TaxID=2004662 RepID=UPI003BAA1EBC
MQYAILFYESLEDFKARDDKANTAYWPGWSAYSSAVGQSGKLASGACLQPPQAGATLKDGTVHDGPYADSKEQLGGFFMIEADSLEDAMEIASRAPAASTGAVEVRPVLPMTNSEG